MIDFNITYPGHHFIKNCEVKRVHAPIPSDYPYTVIKTVQYESLFYALRACFTLTSLNPNHDMIENGDAEAVKSYVKLVNSLLESKDGHDGSYFTFNGVKV